MDREDTYTRAIELCESLAGVTVYERIGGQILLPKQVKRMAIRPKSLVLLPLGEEPSAEALEAVAKIGTTFVVVRPMVDNGSDRQIESAVVTSKSERP